MDIAFLDAGKDAGAWREALDRLPIQLRDVYYEPDYVALHCLQPGARALLAVYADDTAAWLYPFLLQPIPGSDGLFDIESPYGYAGPQCTTASEDFLGRAHAAFREGVRKLGAVAEFIRFHPVLDTARWSDSEVEVIEDRETRLLAIPGEGDVLEAFTAKARNMVRRARREGLTVAEPAMADCWEQFEHVYSANMNRLGADRFYFFNPAYFAGLAGLVDRKGFLLAAERDGKWNAAALFLYGPPGLLHYHLAASSTGGRVPGAANLLIAEAARIGREQQCRRLHLGGGRTSDPDDSLLSFKRAMGGEALSFKIGKRVLDPGRYRALKKEWESEYPDLVPVYGNRILCYRYTA